jgi:hypothetical protein
MITLNQQKHAKGTGHTHTHTHTTTHTHTQILPIKKVTYTFLSLVAEVQISKDAKYIHTESLFNIGVWLHLSLVQASQTNRATEREVD